MEVIRHRIGITASRSEVLEKLSTLEGLASWWTRDVTGDPSADGHVAFFFGSPEPSVVMQVVRADDDQVVWQSIAGPEEWVGNPLTFDLDQAGDETVLNFSHAWREPCDFMGHCSMKWAVFLLGLKSSLEGGKGTPFPGEPQISSWG